jgi:fucose permease
MLLPSMASSLKLSYAQIGFISTGNFIGYLIAVLLCAPLARKIGSRRLIILALAVIALSCPDRWRWSAGPRIFPT